MHGERLNRNSPCPGERMAVQICFGRKTHCLQWWSHWFQYILQLTVSHPCLLEHMKFYMKILIRKSVMISLNWKKLLFLEQTQINGVVLWALMFSTVQNECWVFWVNGPEAKQIKETNTPNLTNMKNIRESGVQQKLRHQRIALPPEMVYKQRNKNFHYE